MTNNRHLFVVCGDLDGESLCMTAETAPEAAAAADVWRQRGATAYWKLRRDVGLDGPVHILGRYRQGIVGESKRSIHIFPLWPGRAVVDSLTAYCNLIMPLSVMEFVNGMPCLLCTVRASHSEDPPARPSDTRPLLVPPLPNRRPAGEIG